MVPPIYFVSRLSFHLEVCGARGVLVIPNGFQQPFGQSFFPQVDLGLLFFKRLSSLTLLLFLHLMFCPFRCKSAA